ncbi:zinc-finger [Saccharopolyspora antimicrobica]|uniref:Zinc finger protein n=1 Tax=Saccharopolyspora antimicrobica TaxID=455193 RepID=A0A1I4YJI3_9PSEU|nr:zinc finger protein [Saccharopolyspora antimicrobica]RKT82702.1 zinc finger protein [Saccharopolyspora antimicrobica]SFN38182.1 zinc-finger [Saccharopolyspora antimicrobica]
MYRPHPFSWVPAAGARHASAEKRPAGGWSDGTTLTALCDQKIQAESGELAWLWATCPGCSKAARVLAGMPPTAVAR